jgi:cardiolipin synthase A/B
VLVDDYSRHVINDTFLSLSRDPVLHAEARATWAMFDALQLGGARLRFTNPVGRNPLNYPLRNHKKLIVTDGVAWIGGINFSDHNFAWHDMMLRIEDDAVADWLAESFDADWQGKPQNSACAIGGALQVLNLDGKSNAAAFAPLLDLFGAATRSIEVVSAYPTFPFVDALAATAKRGVPVTLYTPRANNKPIIRDYLMGVARRTGIEIRLLPEMTHVKAALIDGEVLVAGSSNFDFVSYRANAEYVATIRDPGLIADFTARLLEPARTSACAPEPGEYSWWRSWRAELGLKIADAAIAGLRQGKPIAEWQGSPHSFPAASSTLKPSAIADFAVFAAGKPQ